jgi:hypothetical protein
MGEEGRRAVREHHDVRANAAALHELFARYATDRRRRLATRTRASATGRAA